LAFVDAPHGGGQHCGRFGLSAMLAGDAGVRYG
jgi:hypothetical protein